MTILPEGEIFLKELYCDGTKERFYVKPPAQPCVAVLDVGKTIDAYSWFAQIFLPQGYPHSVSKDYMAYQLWDTAQAFCSTITGILATQEVLRGVGVGDTSATPLAATITWVIKDGCGHMGRILFAFTHGTHLDAYSKKWRLYADVLNDAAMCIEISLPLFRNYTTFALCVSTTMKAIVGVAGGATRVALTQHHALRGNLADVSAKDSAQETAVNLVASVTALLLITVIGNSVVLFFFTMVLHITFNYLAVRSVCLRTLNEPRYLQVISTYVMREVIPTPCDVNRQEPVVFYQAENTLDLRICGFKIKLGRSLKNVTNMKCKQPSYLRTIMDTYSDRKYLLFPDVGSRVMYVMLRETAGAEDVVRGYFHAVLLASIVCAINSEPLPIYEFESDGQFARVCRTVQAAEWSRAAADDIGGSGFLYEPSGDLTRFLDSVVRKEWPLFSAGLVSTGWDISKHLLICDEWRITCHALETKGVNLSNDEDEKYSNFPISYDIDRPIKSKELRDELCIIEPNDVFTSSSDNYMNSSKKMKLNTKENNHE